MTYLLLVDTETMTECYNLVTFAQQLDGKTA